MTPKQLHNQLAPLIPLDPDNLIMQEWSIFTYVTAVTGDFENFAEIVMQPAGRGGLYIAPKFPNDCKCISCKRMRLLQDYAATMPAKEPAQMRLI